MLMSRGYSSDTHSTLLTAYYNAPTKLQLASYGIYVTDLVRNGRVEKLNEAFALGLSPNACNIHGESIVHTACRLSDIQTLDVLIKAGCDVQVSDDNGRTPLHDACSSVEPNFRLIEKLLNMDKHLLFLADKRGHLPLSYTRQHHWSLWLQFLESRKNDYWPLHCGIDGSDSPNLTLLMPHSRPVCDPQHALSIDISRMVATGSLKPSEVELLFLNVDDSGGTVDIDSDDDDDDDLNEDSDDDDRSIEIFLPSYKTSFEDTRYQDSWNTTEMENILESIDSPIKRPLIW
jgi:Ankyrin repeats (3 copies)